MKRLAALAAILLSCAPCAATRARAEEPLAPEEAKASVLKDCKTYKSFCAAKHARIKEALRHGGDAEATQVCERLIAEESRTLKRVIWYLGLDRAQKATRETLEKLLAKVEATPPPDALKATVASRYAFPAWLADPFNYKEEGAEEKKDDKKAAK